MPFAGFDDWDDCMRTMTEEEGHDEESAQNICRALQAEAKSDHGNVDELKAALRDGAGLVADVGVDLVSGVDVPAVDSKWVMLKADGDHDYQVTTPIVLDKQDGDDDDDEDRRISYAAAMIPREPDKEGDVVPTATVERAAHDFLKSDGGIDTDHSLIDGEGEPVESWVLKQDREFDLPDGGTETYPEGTWMLGVEWGADAWERIKSGELTGLSIYGMAEHVALERTAKQLDIPLATEAVVHLVYESRTAAEKASEEIGLEGAVHDHTFDGMDVWMPGETHEAFVDTYMDLSEEAVEQAASIDATPDTLNRSDGPSDSMGEDNQRDDSGDGADPTLKDVMAELDSLSETVAVNVDTIESMKADDMDDDDDEEETDKQDTIDDAVAMVADEYEMSADAVFDIMDAAAGMDAQSVLEAIDSIEASAKDDDVDQETAEKRADEANMSKGGDSRDTAAKQHEESGGSSGLPSYAEAAAAHEQESD